METIQYYITAGDPGLWMYDQDIVDIGARTDTGAVRILKRLLREGKFDGCGEVFLRFYRPGDGQTGFINPATGADFHGVSWV